MNSRGFSDETSERFSLSGVLLAVAFLAAHPVFAGVNRWTSHGPEGQSVSALAIDPLKPTTLYLLVIYTILAFQVFERVYVMTNGGGPNNATITIVQLIYSTAFQFGRYGLASAMAVVLFLVAVALAVIQFRSLRTDVEY